MECACEARDLGIFSKTLEDYLAYVRESEHFDSTHYATCMEYSETIADGVEVSVWRAEQPTKGD